MSIIYIRHGKDKESKYKHDEKLSQEGKQEILEFTEKLVQENGFPDIIYYSPFRRTQQTAKYMIKKLNEMTDKKILYKSDVNLGRFFTRNQRYNPSVRKSTFRKGVIVEERYEEFKDRVEEQIEDMENKEHEIIWNITHSLVLLHVAKVKRIERDKRVEYLDTLVIKK